ncbi:MAG: hypothetical protein KAS39_00040, partial [Actinomycetia bacterium]|nr:hypothetical protein [Actinomycetes bacterium]
EYDRFAELVDEIYIIDHHFTVAAPENIPFYNVAVPEYVQCSNSYLMREIASELSVESDFIDFCALIGLKGDFAIDPSTGIVVEYVKDFYEQVMDKFSGYLSDIAGEGTMFDVEQRDKSSLLSIVTEFIHAVSGGGFQFFYNNREPALKDVDAPVLIFKNLVEIEKIDFLSAKTLDDFIKLLPDNKILGKLFDYYKSDWKTVMIELKSSSRVDMINKYAIYLYMGENIKLLPMAGSIKLFEIKQAIKKDVVLILCNQTAAGIHISFRASSNDIHSGKICTAFQDNFKVYLPELAGSIFGGGHPRAAEFKINSPEAKLAFVLKTVMEYILELSALAEKISAQPDDEELKKKGLEKGLEYLL